MWHHKPNEPTIRLLKSNCHKLAPHVSFVCKVKREGTILYRSNGDIMHALSYSLAENKNHDWFTNVTNVLNNLCTNKRKVSSRGTKDILRHYLRCPWITFLHQSIQYFYLSWHSQKGSDNTDLLAMMSVQCILCVCYFSLSAMSHYTFL